MAAAFLESWSSTSQPHRCTILSLNIQGAKTKLQSPHFAQYLTSFDVICLHELKTAMTIHLPGYVCYREKGENSHRGGSAVLVKNALTQEITYLRIPSPECIFMRLRRLPGILLATCYVAPADSPYHSFAPIYPRSRQKWKDIPSNK